MGTNRWGIPGLPMGEQPVVERVSAGPVVADTFAGRIHVEWDSGALVTPLGQLPFFIEYLKQGGLFDGFVADCPLHYTSPNAPTKRDVLGTVLLSVLQGHLDYTTRPLLSEPWILDIDTTVKPLYGHQEGAVVSYNPHKPGRPSHSYHCYMGNRGKFPGGWGSQRFDDHRGTRSRDCRRIWPQSASPDPGAAFLRTSHLRADRRASQWHGREDFKAASRPPADGQAREVPRRGRSGVESRPRRRLCHGRRHWRAPRRQERLHHADRLRYLHGVSHRPEQIAPGVSVTAVRRHGALCDQRRGARLYERPPTPAGRHRQVRGSQGAYFLAHRGLGAAFAGAGPDRPERRSGSCSDRQRRRAVGRDPASRAVAGHCHRFRRRRPVPRRRPCAVLGSRRTPRPQTG